MSKIDCGSCDNLRENAPEFSQNGVTDTVCTSLQNDTGFNPNLSTLHTDCEDLHDANDCLVGRLDDEVEAYDVCDWKPFMHKFLPNLYELLKAGICALCGVWKKIWEHECEINALYDGKTWRMGEVTDVSKTHVVAGQGVSFLERSASLTSSDINLTYIGGALCRGGGSLTFHSTDFVDADGTHRSGNPVWATTGDTVSGNELIYQIRIKKSEYPEIERFFNGFGQQVDGGGYSVTVEQVVEGYYASGQHGGCDPETGEPTQSGFSRGTLVPAGWLYLSVRCSWIDEMIKTGQTSRNLTPVYFLGVRLNKSGLKC